MPWPCASVRRVAAGHYPMTQALLLKGVPVKVVEEITKGGRRIADQYSIDTAVRNAKYTELKAAFEKALQTNGIERVVTDRFEFVRDSEQIAVFTTLDDAKTLAKYEAPKGTKAVMEDRPYNGTVSVELRRQLTPKQLEKRNAELEAATLSEGQRRVEALESKEAAERALENVQALFRVEDEILRGVRGIEQYLERDESVLPAMFSWQGLPPPAAGDEPDYASMLAEAKRYNDAILKASTKLEMLNRQIHDLEDDRLKLVNELRGLCPVSDEALAQAEAGLKEGEDTLTEARDAIMGLQRSIDGAKADFQFAVAMHTAALEKRAQLEKQIKSTKQEISALEFNNALVKKIRAARPVIGNKLWSMVLASVSTVFSQMRGENSIVSKEKDGFTVNGKSVDSLSGSTLDLLGLAIRCALTKTFVPGCQFIVLDEPSASCDASREAAMLGYIAASGFSQVLLVTHSDVSESFANNLITL